MSQTTAIEWTDVTWNPTHGCSKVSPGCAHCYAETLSLRYGQTTAPWTPANAEENVLLKPHKLREPLSGAKAWQGLGDAAAAAGKTEGKLVFVNSMSDLFHEQVPFAFIDSVFDVMREASQHTFQILTKRPKRMRSYVLERMEPAACVYTPAFPLPNVWLGTSIENRRFVHRADVLRATPAAVRFISAEPLLGPLIAEHHLAVPPVDDHDDGDPEHWEVVPFWDDQPGPGGPEELDLAGIDWLIAGGESGPGHRPMRPEWVRDLRDVCAAEGVAFLFKQWGGHTPKAGGRELDGRTHDDMPKVLAHA